jgi:hypothetical protein
LADIEARLTDQLQKVFELVVGEVAVGEDLAEQAGADGFAAVDGHSGHPAVRVLQAMMAPLRTDDFKAELFQGADELFAGNPLATRHQATFTC